MDSPDTLNDNKTRRRNEGVSSSHPRRAAFWAHRVIRMMNKSCAANDIGPDGFTLVATIAMTEDAKRY